MNESTKLHINNLANRYLQNKDDLVFSSLYKTIASEMSLRLERWEQSTELAESHEMTTCFHDSILSTFDKMEADGGGDFVKLFMTIVNNSYKSLLRMIRTQRKYWYKDSNDCKELKIERVIDRSAEKKKKDADKRELINVLLQGEDALTTGIVNEYLSIDPNEKISNRKIANKVECDHKTVKSRLEKLKSKCEAIEKFYLVV